MINSLLISPASRSPVECGRSPPPADRCLRLRMVVSDTGRRPQPGAAGFVTPVTAATPASAGGSRPASLATPTPPWPRERCSVPVLPVILAAGVAKATLAWPKRRWRGQSDRRVADRTARGGLRRSTAVQSWGRIDNAPGLCNTLRGPGDGVSTPTAYRGARPMDRTRGQVLDAHP